MTYTQRRISEKPNILSIGAIGTFLHREAEVVHIDIVVINASFLKKL